MQLVDHQELLDGIYVDEFEEFLVVVSLGDLPFYCLYALEEPLLEVGIVDSRGLVVGQEGGSGRSYVKIGACY